jgi:hypothetical protein
MSYSCNPGVNDESHRGVHGKRLGQNGDEALTATWAELKKSFDKCVPLHWNWSMLPSISPESM